VAIDAEVQTAPAPSVIATESEAAEDSLIGRLVDGRYRIHSMLGAGAMGAVYAGEHVALHKRVAIKVLHGLAAQSRAFRARFEREAQAASRLAHPGCVSVLDFGRVARIEPADGAEPLLGTPYLVMELVKGELLADRIARGKLPPEAAIVITRGVLAALRHAHGLDLVHRDVKPANIMLASIGDTAVLVKLLDFGLAKSMAADSPDRRQPLTEVGLVFGTPEYISPEQASGNPADGRSDLYALGVVLFEMVCGAPPFCGTEAIEIVREHLVTPVPPPQRLTPSLSKELRGVIETALEKEPAQRFQSADQFMAALARCPEALSPAAPTAQATPQLLPGAPEAATARRRISLLDLWVSRPRRLLRVAAVALLLVLVGWIAAHLRSQSQAATATMILAPEEITHSGALPAEDPARAHLAHAAEYQRKLWCTDALNELQRALQAAPELRTEPELMRIAVPCLRARTQARAIQFLVDEVGPAAIPALQAALHSSVRADVREGAQRVLERLAPPR
jgi:serine/threonine protein kinase